MHRLPLLGESYSTSVILQVLHSRCTCSRLTMYAASIVFIYNTDLPIFVIYRANCCM